MHQFRKIAGKMDNRLFEAWKQLDGVWDESLPYWDDANRLEFEQTFWIRITEVVNTFLKNLTELENRLDAASKKIEQD